MIPDPKFQRAWTFLKLWECVYDHAGNVICEDVPGDGGGLTKYGVDQASHPHLNIRALTEDQAAQIYHDTEWVRCRCAELPADLAVALFDFAVNSGMGTASKKFQEVLGLEDDGWIGPETIATANAEHAVQTTLANFISRREAYMRAIAADHPSQQKFLRGWLTRAEDLRIYLPKHPLSSGSLVAAATKIAAVLIVAFLLGLILGGCAVGPSFERLRASPYYPEKLIVNGTLGRDDDKGWDRQTIGAGFEWSLKPRPVVVVPAASPKPRS